MNIKSFESAKRTEELLIPGFVADEKISIEVQRPNLLSMVRQKKIPNELLGVAQSLVSGTPKKVSDKEAADHTLGVLEVYLRAVMVNPTYDEVSDVLTDEQTLFIQEWAVKPAKEVADFRTNKEDGADNRNGDGLSEKTE